MAKKDLIYISFEACDKRCLEDAIRKFISTITQADVAFKGPVFLPTKGTDFTFNRSPHIDKKSREQFEMAVHKRLVVLCNATGSNILQTLSLDDYSSGVETNVKLSAEAKGDK